MAGEEPAAILHELLQEMDPPTRTQMYDRGTSASFPDNAKDDEQAERSAKLEMVLRWAVYGTQVAVSVAVFHPFSYARILMELGFEPAPPRPSRTLFGKPCLLLPNIGTYVRFIKNRDGRWQLWRGFGAHFCCVLIGNLSNDLSYHLIDEFIKRKVRSSPRKAWSVFVMANQENTRYSPADFAEDLTKEVLARAVGLTLSYPFQVVFLRIAAQFVWQEKVYNGLYDSFLQIYQKEGFKGFYGGYVPYMINELGALIVVWIAAYVFRSVVTADRIWLTIFRFAADYVMRTMLYPFKLVGRIMAISPSSLKIVSPPLLPKFQYWRDCFEYLKAQNCLMRGNNIFMRIISTDKSATWEKYGYRLDAATGSPVAMLSSSNKTTIMEKMLPSQIVMSSRRVDFSTSSQARRSFPFGTFRTSF